MSTSTLRRAGPLLSRAILPKRCGRAAGRARLNRRGADSWIRPCSRLGLALRGNGGHRPPNFRRVTEIALAHRPQIGAEFVNHRSPGRAVELRDFFVAAVVQKL